MTQISLPITSRTAADDNLYSDVYDNDLAITNVVNGGLDGTNFTGGSISGADIAAGTITDSHLASPNNHVYRLLLEANAFFSSGFASSGVVFLPGTYDGDGEAMPSYAGQALGPDQGHAPMWHYNSFFQPVGGKTLQFTLVTSYLANTTSPGVTFTVALYPITGSISASGGVGYALGSAASGSGASFTPGTYGKTASSFTGLTHDTSYVIGVFLSGTVSGTQAAVRLSAQLLFHNV